MDRPESSVVLEAAKYSAFKQLRDGRRVEIRALRPEDRFDLLEAVRRTSAKSLYRRFFVAKRGITEQEIMFFVNIDFVTHVALVAVMEEGGRRDIVGGGRYIVVQPARAEVAFVVVDRFQGQGIGAGLMHHLVAIARGAGLQELIAQVLPDNIAMLGLLKDSGFRLDKTRGSHPVFGVLRL